ncbi:MAG: PilZ domain-containing protein, partial [Acidimicrobiia bacterium]
VNEEGEALDLSPGGVRLRARDRLGTGDVVLCSVDVAGSEVDLKGLVVHTSGRKDGYCDVHVAWTNLSDDARDGLDRLLELQESVGQDGDARADGRHLN